MSTPLSTSLSIRLSKKLSHTLRHDDKIGIQPDGFIPLATLLNHPRFKGYSEKDVQDCVDINTKQRFTIENGMIRANQGHSLSVPDLELVILTEADLVDTSVIHGTYKNIWKQIEKQGLSRMGRNHIHFTTQLPSEGQVISGMRQSCNVFIYVDAIRAIQDGYTFYKSANGVILCPGNEKGILPPKYIKSIIICP